MFESRDEKKKPDVLKKGLINYNPKVIVGGKVGRVYDRGPRGCIAWAIHFFGRKKYVWRKIIWYMLLI